MNPPDSPQAPTPPTPAAPATTAHRRGNHRPRHKRWLPFLLGILFVVVVVAGFRPQPAPVETVKVQTGRLRATVSEEGRTRIRHRFAVSAPVTGQLRRIPFKAGHPVEAQRTVVAVIDPLPASLLDPRTRSLAEARRDTAAANLEKARAAHRFAVGDLRRFQQLFAEGTVSKAELESFEWREAAATKELAAAESALRQAEAELSEFNGAPPSDNPAKPVEVTAPVSGRVLRVLEENARVVTAGTPLLEIGDPRDLEVVIEVLSRDGATIQPGAPIEFDQWGPGQPLRGTVRLVEPAAFTKVSALGVEEQRVNVIADLLAPPDQRPGLGDHFRVEAHIVVWEATNVLKTANGALFRRGQEWAAFRLADGRARLGTVRTGRSSGTETQILEGLNEGDELILYPGDRIHDGQRVRPITISP